MPHLKSGPCDELHTGRVNPEAFLWCLLRSVLRRTPAQSGAPGRHPFQYAYDIHPV